MRFIVMADSHFITPELAQRERNEPGGEIWWNRVLWMRQEEVREALLRTISIHAPDFILHCGDLTECGDAASLDLARDFARHLPCPFYWVRGNHDTLETPDALSAWYSLPAGRPYYAFTAGVLRVVMLDTCTCQYADRSLGSNDRLPGAHYVVPPEELAWLEEELIAHAENTVLLVSHHAIAAKPIHATVNSPYNRPLLRDPAADARSGLSPQDLCNARDVQELLRRHGNVKIAFSGHWHINDAYRQDGVVHCQTGAMHE